MVCCWWCTLDIGEKEYNLPYKYEPERRKFHTMGHFCSWECVKSYNLHERNAGWGSINSNITLMRTRMYGRTTRLRCAPHRNCLIKFGGTLTEDEFRNYTSPEPPVVTMPTKVQFLHEVVEKKYVPRKTTPAEDKRRIAEINNSCKKSDTLKLKRPIPIKYKKNNLEEALGLVRKPV